MTQINLNGKEFNLAYTMQTAIAYERITGKSAFDLSQFQDQQLTPLITLGYCMLISSNDINKVPTFDSMVEGMTSVKETTEFIKAVNDELIAFFAVGKGDEDGEEKTEEESKNA